MYKIHIMREKLIKSKFQNVIPKEVREKLYLSPRQTVDEHFNWTALSLTISRNQIYGLQQALVRLNPTLQKSSR